MADTYSRYVASGSQKDFEVTFNYRSQGDVVVYIDGVSIDAGGTGHTYSWVDSNTIRVTKTNGDNPDSGTVVLLRRETSVTNAAVTFQAGALSVNDLNDNNEHVRYAVQEAQERANDNESDIDTLEAEMDAAQASLALLEADVTVSDNRIISNALLWAAAQNEASPGSVTIDENGVEDSEAGINAWITAALAAGVRRLRLPEGTYRITSPILFYTNMWLEGDGYNITKVNAEYCNGLDTGTPNARVSHFHVRNIGFFGTDGLDEVTNTDDHRGINMANTIRCSAEYCYTQGFTLGNVIDGTDQGAVSGASHTYFRHCENGVGGSNVNHGNNSYPGDGFRMMSDTVNGGPDACGFDTCTSYYATANELQEFTGDGSNEVFTMSAMFSELKHYDQLRVEVDGLLVERSGNYLVSGLGTTTPTVDFNVAPGVGAAVKIRFTPWEENCYGFHFREANGAWAHGCNVSGYQAAYRYNERRCEVRGGYIQLCREAAEFTANSNDNVFDVQSIGITEATVLKIVVDSGKRNRTAPGFVNVSGRSAGDLVKAGTSSFSGSGDTALAPNATVSDACFVFRAEGDLILEPSGGAPTQLSCFFGLQWFDERNATWTDVHEFEHEVVVETGSKTRQRVSVTLVDASPPYKAFDPAPQYRLALKAGTDSQATWKAGANHSLSEENYAA